MLCEDMVTYFIIITDEQSWAYASKLGPGSRSEIKFQILQSLCWFRGRALAGPLYTQQSFKKMWIFHPPQLLSKLKFQLIFIYTKNPVKYFRDQLNQNNFSPGLDDSADYVSGYRQCGLTLLRHDSRYSYQIVPP